ncbi:MAG: Isopenicillin N epimerase [Bryobacteraceae bacterium]|nr:Isopenicillin N epimerase [Bryobacteraceae bacterium]
MQRRTLLRSAAGFACLRPGSGARAFALSRETAGLGPEEAARDERYWREIQQAFEVDRNIINLNNGGVSPSPRLVMDAVRRYQEYSNLAPAHVLWRVLEPELESVRRRLADAFGCSAEELAITRNASESLEICQLGLDLKRGDEVLTTDQDYPRMLTTWEQRVRREGIVLRKISFPVPPPSMDDLYQRFEAAITPRTRAILLCHITNLTGQIFPVQRICRMARGKGISTIVDGAHAIAHFPFRLADLECDYYGASLHKWLTAPLGTGLLYVRKEKIRGLWPMMAAPESMADNIRKFEEIGTHPAANHNAIAEALVFYEGMGAERKAARLRYLRSLWVDRLGRLPAFELFTSRDPEQSCGLATFGIRGTDMAELGARLFEKYRVLTTPIIRQDYKGIRVTPNVYTTLKEIDVFCTAVEKLTRFA